MTTLRLFPLTASLAALLTGCQSAHRAQPVASPIKTAIVQQDDVPAAAETKTEHAIWIKYPPASPVFVLAALTADYPQRETDFTTPITAAADAMKADFVLTVPNQEYVNALSPSEPFAELWRTATLPPDSALPPSRVRVLFLKRTPGAATVFQNGYFDPASNTTSSRFRADLYRWRPGQAYNRTGAFVTSPFAPNKPAIDVSGLPDGAEIICPYTHRIFTLR